MPPAFLLVNKAQMTPLWIITLRTGIQILGRSPTCDHVIAHKSISRKHAEIRVTGSKVRVTDLGSKFGSFRNEVRLVDLIPNLGDNIRFGQVSFVLTQRIASPEDDSTVREVITSSQGASLAEQIASLTEAQLEVLELLKKGMSEKAIANHLKNSRNTVHNHIRAIYAKFGAHTRAELLVLFRKLPPDKSK